MPSPELPLLQAHHFKDFQGPEFGKPCLRRVWLQEQERQGGDNEPHVKNDIQTIHRRFPDGVLVPLVEGQEDSASDATAEHIENNETTIYQATAIAHLREFNARLMATVDVLKFNESTGKWDIYFASEALEIDEAGKYYILAALQKMIFEEARYAIGEVYITHVNGGYSRPRTIGLNDPQSITDPSSIDPFLYYVEPIRVTEAVTKIQSKILHDIKKVADILSRTAQPEVKLGKQCGRNSRTECGFVPVCFEGIPEYSVFDISLITQKKLDALLGLGILAIEDVPEAAYLEEAEKKLVQYLLENGVTDIASIPEDLKLNSNQKKRISKMKGKGYSDILRFRELDAIPEDFSLSDPQRRQVEAAKESLPLTSRENIEEMIRRKLINPEAIEKMVGEDFVTRNGRCAADFLDYETNANKDPLPGYSPYEQMVTQFSCDRINGLVLPIFKGAQAPQFEHFEFLAPSLDYNPVPKVVVAEKACLPKSENRVFVWYKTFETGRNTEMGRVPPVDVEYFADMNSRVIDLMDVFKEGHFVHRDFKGRLSIKVVSKVIHQMYEIPEFRKLCESVIPDFDPEKTYANSEIKEGKTATDMIFRCLFDPNVPDEEREEIRKNLLHYCSIDTLEMVIIYLALQYIIHVYREMTEKDFSPVTPGE